MASWLLAVLQSNRPVQDITFNGFLGHRVEISSNLIGTLCLSNLISRDYKQLVSRGMHEGVKEFLLMDRKMFKTALVSIKYIFTVFVL